MTDDAFAGLMAEVMATAHRFGHREHIHLTWLAVRHYGVGAAVGLVSDGIQRTARYAGAPQKYNATVSRAWVELVAHHVGQHLGRQAGQHVGQDVGQRAGRQVGQHVGHQAREFDQGDDFAAFVDGCPDLLDKRC